MGSEEARLQNMSVGQIVQFVEPKIGVIFEGKIFNVNLAEYFSLKILNLSQFFNVFFLCEFVSNIFEGHKFFNGEKKYHLWKRKSLQGKSSINCFQYHLQKYQVGKASIEPRQTHLSRNQLDKAHTVPIQSYFHMFQHNMDYNR